MDFKKTTAIVITAAIMAAGQASAEMYLGAGLGMTSFDEQGLEDSNGFTLSAGHRFSDNFAVQIGYTALGTFDVNAQGLRMLESLVSAEYGIPPGELSLSSTSVEIDGPELSLIAFFPFNDQFSGYARLGVFSWSSSMDFAGSNGGENFSFSASDDGTDLVYGFGLDYSLNEQWSLNAEMSTYDAFASEISYIGVGAKVNF